MVFWVESGALGLIALITWATSLPGKWKHIVLSLTIVALLSSISGHVSDRKHARSLEAQVMEQATSIRTLEAQAIPQTERKSLAAARSMVLISAGGGL